MDRRTFLRWLSRTTAASAALALGAPARGRNAAEEEMLLFLAGDVMLGRGVDQVLPSSVDPELHEPFVRSAERYVELAEGENGPIPAPVPHAYPWGEALAVLDGRRPHARIVNLETAVTRSDDWWQGKGIHYRMHPGNVATLTAAELDACVLANNHVLDWGRSGLLETLDTLHDAGLATPGAGADADAADAPARLDTAAGRLLVFAYATPDAGVPAEWQAGEERAGVNFLPDVTSQRADAIAAAIDAHRRPGDRVLVSLHWGGNWGYQVPPSQREFAHRLIEAGAADVLHGHSSHHPKGIEVYRERLVLYGCGDLLNDYEGIGGHEEFRPELSLLYLPRLTADGALAELEMAPMRIRRFRLEHAGEDEARWLADRLTREGEPLGTRVEAVSPRRLMLRWGSA